MRENKGNEALRRKYAGKPQLTLEQLQAVLQHILQDIHDCCVAEGLHYTLFYGTLLGYQRHGDFLPWDDDADVGMLRGDYMRLVERYNAWAEKEGRDTRLVSMYHDKTYPHPYAKVFDTKTLKFEQMYYGSWGVHGVDVDLFPVDELPVEGPAREALVKQQTRLFRRLQLSLRGYENAPSRWKYHAGRLVSLVYPTWLRRYYLQKLNAQPPAGDTPFCTMALAPRHGVLKVYEKSAFGEFMLVPFGNAERMVAKGYISLLEKMYKNYLKVPKKEKQISHHDSEAYYIDEDGAGT